MFIHSPHKTPNAKRQTPYPNPLPLSCFSLGTPLHYAILLLVVRPERHRQHGPQLERGKGNQAREAKERNDDYRDYVTVRFVINGALILVLQKREEGRKEGEGVRI